MQIVLIADSLNLDRLDQIKNPDELIKDLTAEKEYLLKQNGIKCSHASTASRKRELATEWQDIHTRYKEIIKRLKSPYPET